MRDLSDLRKTGARCRYPRPLVVHQPPHAHRHAEPMAVLIHLSRRARLSPGAA